MSTNTKYLLIAFVAFFGCQKQVTAQTCRDGWTTHEESCYFVHNASLNWEMAKIVCGAVNGQLVTIETAAENNFLASMLHGCGVDKAWIGLEDIVVEGEYRWTSNQERPEYVNWDAGNPSNSGVGGEDCCEIVGGSGHWNDVACETAARAFICETEASEVNGPVIG